MYSTLSWTRTLVFFFDRRALSLFFVRGVFFAMSLERLLVAARVRGLGLVRNGPAATAAAHVAALAALVLDDLGRGPAQARTDFVGDDLDDRPLLAVLGLVRPLLEAAVEDHASPLLQRVRHVLAQGGPGGDVE